MANQRIVGGASRLILAMAVVLVILVLAGCDKPPQGIPSTNVGYGTVKEMRLSDGTRCAVYDGYKGGGVTCDWRGVTNL